MSPPTNALEFAKRLPTQRAAAPSPRPPPPAIAALQLPIAMTTSPDTVAPDAAWWRTKGSLPGPISKHLVFNSRILALVCYAVLCCAGVHAQAAAPAANVAPATNAPTNKPTATLQPGQMPYFDVVPDPLEGLNRVSWEVNEGLFRGVIYPLSFAYNFVAPKPVRERITDAGRNLSYPVRFFNSCFQGKWQGAWQETERFGVNSTIGLGGLFDPATKWKIGRSDEDFGLTLGHYGTRPWFYLMIPLIGPSNGRDALGKIADIPLDICFWISYAYPDELWPDAIRPGIAFNDLSGSAPEYNRLLNSVVDPYLALRTLYSLNRQRLILNYRPKTGGNFNPDPTIGAVLFKAITPNFVDQAVTYARCWCRAREKSCITPAGCSRSPRRWCATSPAWVPTGWTARWRLTRTCSTGTATRWWRSRIRSRRSSWKPLRRCRSPATAPRIATTW